MFLVSALSRFAVFTSLKFRKLFALTCSLDNIFCKMSIVSRSVLVRMSSSALGMLLYENVNAKPGQDGFLVGDVCETRTRSMTDDAGSVVRIKQIINVTAVVACDISHLFYDNQGELIPSQLQEMLGDKKDDVVAWFKFKNENNRGFSLSARERVIHHELSKYFDIKIDLFNCLVLVIKKENRTNYAYSHCYINYSGVPFKEKKVPMVVVNLGESCHVYKTKTKSSPAFRKVFNSVDINSQSEWQLGKNIQHSLQKQINTSVGHLTGMEEKLADLRHLVDKLNVEIRQASLRSLKSITVDEDPQHLTVTVEAVDVAYRIDNAGKLAIKCSNAGTRNYADGNMAGAKVSSTPDLQPRTAASLSDEHAPVLDLIHLDDSDDCGGDCSNCVAVPITDTALIDLTMSGDEEMAMPSPLATVTKSKTRSKQYTITSAGGGVPRQQ